MNDKPKIDPEFRALIPPLSPEERDLLEKSILEHGCRDSLVTWRGILLDGHNRFDICQQHGVEFSTLEVDLPDRDAALDWMDGNQLGRRNLTPEQMSLLRGRIYNRSKKTRAEAGAIGGSSKDQNDTCLPNRSTAKQLAEKHGVSAPTIKRDGQFVAAVESLSEHVPDIEARVFSGEFKRRDVIEAAEDPARAAEILDPGRKREKKSRPATSPDLEVEALRAEIEDLRAQLAELAAQCEETLAENMSMSEVLEADDRVTAALEEAKKYRELYRIEKERSNSLINEKDAAIRAAKSWQRKAGAA